MKHPTDMDIPSFQPMTVQRSVANHNTSEANKRLGGKADDRKGKAGST